MKRKDKQMGRFDKYKTNVTKKQGQEDIQAGVAKEIELMKNQDQYNLQFIKITKLIKSPFNKFDEYKESKAGKWKEIKDSIKEYGILNPLKVILNDQGLYEVLGGWNRTQMIKELIDEGNTKFLDGVPCYVLTNISEIDQQIISEIDNTGEGHTEPQEVRESIARLAILYQQKNEQNGTNKSIVKQISQDTGLGERQVQRYNSINKKMIPELQSYFDNKQINIENGSKIADLDEEGQKFILNLLEQSDSSKKISADEIKIAKEQSKNLQEKYEKELQAKEELAKKLEEQTSVLSVLEDEKKKLQEQNKQALEEKDKEIKNALLKIEEREVELKSKLEQERENLETEQIQKFKNELEKLSGDKEILSLQKEELEAEKEQLEKKVTKAMEEKEKEIKQLKNKIENLEKKESEKKDNLDATKIEELKLEIKIKESIKDVIYKLGIISTQISKNESLKKNLQDELEKLQDTIKQVDL